MKKAQDENREPSTMVEPEEDTFFRDTSTDYGKSIDGILNAADKYKATGNEIILDSIPNTIAIIGAPGTGRNAFAQELAKRLGLLSTNVDFNKAKVRYVGESEKYTSMAIEAIVNSSNTVFDLEGLDGGSSSEGVEGHGSNVQRSILSAIEDNIDKLRSRKVFIVIVSTGGIRSQLMDRFHVIQ